MTKGNEKMLFMCKEKNNPVPNINMRISQKPLHQLE